MEKKRQGDLLIIKIEELDTKNMKPSSLVLAEGETTGHKHRLQGNAQVYEFENQKYLQVQEAELVHEEHQKLELEKGFYKVVNQREYSYLDEQIRRVQD